MGLLSGLLGKKSPKNSQASTTISLNLEGPGDFALPIVGESYYQEALEAICGKRKREGEERIIRATVVQEDDNPHDKMAVAVRIRGDKVGHLSRDRARQYRKQMKQAGYPGRTATCQAQIRGGWDKGGGAIGHYGVWLDLPMKID